jgi:hypothetical protein
VPPAPSNPSEMSTSRKTPAQSARASLARHRARTSNSPGPWVVTAAIVQRAIYFWKPFTQFVVTLFCTALDHRRLRLRRVLARHRARPRRAARSGQLVAVKVPTEPQGKRFTADVTEYGAGYGYQEGQQTFIHMDRSQCNLISWFPSASTAGTYYAQVDVKQMSGSDATACELSFAWKNENSAFELSLRTDGVQLAYWDGNLPARVFEGPVTVPYATNLGDWHTIAVLVERSWFGKPIGSPVGSRNSNLKIPLTSRDGGI